MLGESDAIEALELSMGKCEHMPWGSIYFLFAYIKRLKLSYSLNVEEA